MAGGRRHSRRMRGGNGYGFGNPIAAGAMEVVPNMTSVAGGAPYKPTGGRRRRGRKTRRRGGVFTPIPGQEPSAPPADDEDLVTKDKCTAAGREWVASGIKAPNGEMLGYCRGTTGFKVVGPMGKHGGRRRSRRKSRKGGRRRRSMRGGGSVAGVGYSFTGEGSRGLADHSAYPANLPPSGAFAIPTGTR